MAVGDRYEAHVRTWGIHPDAAEIFLVERFHAGRRAYPLIDGEIHPMLSTDEILQPGFSMSPLLLPREFCEPLRDALDEALGRPHDDFRSRYEEAQVALMCERQRIDNYLDLFGRAAERALFPPGYAVEVGELRQERRPI